MDKETRRNPSRKVRDELKVKQDEEVAKKAAVKKPTQKKVNLKNGDAAQTKPATKKAGKQTLPDVAEMVNDTEKKPAKGKKKVAQKTTPATKVPKKPRGKKAAPPPPPPKDDESDDEMGTASEEEQPSVQTNIAVNGQRTTPPTDYQSDDYESSEDDEDSPVIANIVIPIVNIYADRVTSTNGNVPRAPIKNAPRNDMSSESSESSDDEPSTSKKTVDDKKDKSPKTVASGSAENGGEEHVSPTATKKPDNNKAVSFPKLDSDAELSNEEDKPVNGNKVASQKHDDSEDMESEDAEEKKPAPKKAAARGKKTKPVNGNADDDDEPPKKKATGRGKKAPAKDSSIEDEPSTSNEASKQPKNNVDTNYSDVDFSIKQKFNLKIASWNVAGIRALATKKKGDEYVIQEDPDIICLNELKCGSDEVPEEFKFKGYHEYLNIGKGLPGVAILSKTEPISVSYDLPDKNFKNEKRLITAEYDQFILVATYVVNAGRGLKTLDKKLEWNDAFDTYIVSLDKKKPVIIAGDMNVAHEEIDLANPKTNKKSAGFTQEERDGFTKLLSLGFIDTFRHFYPEKTGAYTFWNYISNSRSRNVGWRLDYFVVSERFMKHVKDNVIRSTILGSDHCPIVLFLDV